MAITTYAELQTAVQNWLSRADADILARTVEFITLAEAKINRKLRIRTMETALSDTIASGTISTPTGYVELKHMYIDGSPVQPLKRISAEQLYGLYPSRSAEGKPKFVALDGGVFIFGPYADSTYTVKGTYYKKVAVLSDAAPTNWYTSNAIDLLLYGSLLQAAPYIKDNEELQVWKVMYEEALVEVGQEDRDEQFSGSAPAVVGG